MKITLPENTHTTWSRIFFHLGFFAMLIGALDPMEGSLLILPGSAAVALGAFLGGQDRRSFAFRCGAFAAIAVGVGALFGLTEVGGIGGQNGLSLWWGLLILPYLVGWSISLWAPSTPRWVSWFGIVVGLWYVALFLIVLNRANKIPNNVGLTPVLIVCALGILTVAGCVFRLAKTNRYENNAAKLTGIS